MTSNYTADLFLFSKNELVTLCCCQLNNLRCLLLFLSTSAVTTSAMLFHCISFIYIWVAPFYIPNHLSLVAHQVFIPSNTFSIDIQNLIWIAKAKDGSTIAFMFLFYGILNSKQNYSFVTSLSQDDFSSCHYLFARLISKGKDSNTYMQLKACNTETAIAKDQSCRFGVCLNHIM